MRDKKITFFFQMEHLPKLLDESNIDNFLDSIDNVMTDCDGKSRLENNYLD